MSVMLSGSAVSFVFLHTKTQPTPSYTMIIDYWSPYDHLNPSHLSLFFLLYSINPLFLAGRYPSWHPQFLFIALVFLRSWNALPPPFQMIEFQARSFKHHWNPHYLHLHWLLLVSPTSPFSEVSLYFCSYELLSLCIFSLSLSLSLSIILFWSLVLAEHI